MLTSSPATAMAMLIGAPDAGSTTTAPTSPPAAATAPPATAVRAHRLQEGVIGFGFSDFLGAGLPGSGCELRTMLPPFAPGTKGWPGDGSRKPVVRLVAPRRNGCCGVAATRPRVLQLLATPLSPRLVLRGLGWRLMMAG